MEVKAEVGCEHISDVRFGVYAERAKNYLAACDLTMYPLTQLKDMVYFLYGEEQNFENIPKAQEFFAKKQL